MGKSEETLDIRLTEEFARAQQNENFQAWLKYQEAAFELEFSLDQVPELPADPFNAEGLRIAERKALSLWDSPQEAFSEQSRSLAFRFVYFIGETLVQRFEGEWINLPRPAIGPDAGEESVDLPFDTGFYDPRGLFKIALHRRTGEEWAFVCSRAEKNYNKWVEAGRPQRELG